MHMRFDEMGSWVLAIAIPIALVAGTIPVLTLLQAVTHAPTATELRPMWSANLGRVDAALADGDVSGGIRAWRAAYTSALGSRRWDAMMDVADAYLRIGDRTPIRRVYEAKAREAYLVGLFRARRDNSLDGVLRAAQSFAELGDREVVAHCLRIADTLAAQGDDAAARERVRQWAQRFANRSVAATEQELP